VHFDNLWTDCQNARTNTGEHVLYTGSVPIRRNPIRGESGRHLYTLVNRRGPLYGTGKTLKKMSQLLNGIQQSHVVKALTNIMLDMSSV